MKKLNALQVMAVLQEVPTTLRKLAAQRDKLAQENKQLREALAERNLNDKISKLAAEIHSKGMDGGRPLEGTIDFLREKHKLGKLEVVAQAVEMQGRRMPLGSLDESTPASGKGTAEASFISALLASS